jgi:hypothetical protein
MKSENGRIKGDLKYRTKKFALNIIELYSSLPRRRAALVIGDQLLRSATSVGAHFREAQRARSNPDFISKLEGDSLLAGAAGRSTILRPRSIRAFDK